MNLLNDGSAVPESTSEWLEMLQFQSTTKVFPPRTIFIHEGEAGDSLYVIRSGRGRIYSTNGSGKEIVFATYGPGDTLGEPSLDGGVRSASVMTQETTTCLIVKAQVVRQLIEENPRFGWRIIENLIRLLRATNDTLKSLALEDVYGRVSRLLVKLAEPVEHGWIVRERLTQQGIADRVGASREMVSRIFKDLTEGGYLQVEDGHIVILKKLPPAW